MGWTLVTGGAKGLGAEICLKLASEGHSVIVHYNQSEEESHRIAAECRRYGLAETIQGDFSSEENVEDFLREYLERFPKTECLVNNVGNYLIKPFLETSVDEMKALYQTNVFAPFMIAKALKVYGSIVNLGVAGLGRADVYSSAYTMAKSGLLQWTRSLAKELAPELISVNMVSPGYVEGSVDLPSPSKLPMKRAVNCEEVANLVAFLLDPKNRSITGQNIEIAGGVRL